MVKCCFIRTEEKKSFEEKFKITSSGEFGEKSGKSWNHFTTRMGEIVGRKVVVEFVACFQKARWKVLENSAEKF
jgi:hypothetical protein